MYHDMAKWTPTCFEGIEEMTSWDGHQVSADLALTEIFSIETLLRPSIHAWALHRSAVHLADSALIYDLLYSPEGRVEASLKPHSSQLGFVLLSQFEKLLGFL